MSPAPQTPLLLPHLRVVTIAGPERSAFLQGQLTQDVQHARADRTVYAGWCDPKGRLLWVGHLLTLEQSGEPAFGLLVQADLADELVAGLRRFLFRTKARIECSDLAVTAHWSTPAGDAPATWIRLAGDAERWLRLEPALRPAEAAAPHPWLMADVQCGLPSIAGETRGEFVPQMVNLDLLDGISFSKGCYTGQEIVARTRYLGRVKRRMLRWRSEGPPPAPGTELRAGDSPAGKVVSAAATADGCEFLAVTILDRLEAGCALPGRAPAVRLELPYTVPELGADAPTG